MSKLILQQKVFDLIVWAGPILEKFPKYSRYTMGLFVREEGLGFLRNIAKTNIASDKRKGMEECLANFEMIKVYGRLCYAQKLISTRQYEVFGERISEIGKLLHGWRKVVQ